ncbi:MAG TPA: superoxide dismutase [Candidatus Magasanikbacteria bacterium]|jgi:Fe-Mn family superoxide dismutase|nr:superoxide dismutase [Candidatus Magasanikbacteria bacterium]HQL52543.1 superoxide dismutase [Candidatus Magasanikbacteria bacterium]
MKFTLPKLNFTFDALEPNIDAQTVETHYTKHHQGYMDNFQILVDKYPELKNLTAEKILTDLEKLNINNIDRTKLKNMGGGYLNHNIYWSNLNPNNTKDKNLIKKINRDFGSIKKFKEQFTQLAITLFGSGWVWLVEKSDGKLDIYQLPNQDSPLTLGHKPILALDVWEHAYYLKYKNKRIDYINAWWNLIKLI